jgi:Anti-sigma-K factor rskA
MNDELLDELLAHPSTWVEPPADLEDAVVWSVAEAAAPMPTVVRSPRRRRRVGGLLGVAAALTAAVVAGSIVLSGVRSNADYTGDLRATGLAPGAHASVVITRTDAGFRVQLDARGLPPLEHGEFYEAWMKDAAGTLVPIGTFSSSDGRVTLWSGVSPDDFPTLTITIEPGDNNQASSGQRVLMGDVHAR